MLANLVPLITLALAGARVAAQQTYLGNSDDGSASFLSLLDSAGGPATETLSTLIVNSFTTQQREELMLKLLEQHDVVDVMHMTGHGEGLDEQRLIEIFGQDGLTIASEGDKLRLKKDGVSFMDVTDNQRLGELNAQRLTTKSIQPLQVLEERKLAVQSMFPADLDATHLKADIEKLSSFWNRSYRSQWGLLSSNWIYDQAEAILNTSNGGTTTSIKKFHHKFPQNSIIARIESADSSVRAEDKEVIIVSAHQDSLNYRLPFYRAPGADDDGSGSVTILQVLRSLVSQSFIPPPHIAIEFQWYAAEEGGLLGSQDVAAAYEQAHADVKGVLHMDMTAFLRNGTTPIIAFFDTNTDKNLTRFGTQVVEEYLPLGWNTTNCGTSCGSDHMSWTKAGYPAIFVAEGLVENFADGIHTINDNLDSQGQYSFEHMLEFVKLGIAFVAEYSVAE
ncbi:Zn-dependent exopeptidase [Athelia psychrophila]|uniref:Peptide hydrolase n=1 Tax=Athelia psychrophila TaxID=1759441 RepID=A0A166HML4_9AGAM|nr:Zn-dependent exopeptidase [Fibularhizoctonia sp. CBS 109695]